MSQSLPNCRTTKIRRRSKAKNRYQNIQNPKKEKLQKKLKIQKENPFKWNISCIPSQIKWYFTVGFSTEILKLIFSYLPWSCEEEIGSILWLKYCKRGYILHCELIFTKVAELYLNEVFNVHGHSILQIQGNKITAFLHTLTQQDQNYLLKTCFQTSNFSIWRQSLIVLGLNPGKWLKSQIVCLSHQEKESRDFCSEISRTPSIPKFKAIQFLDPELSCLDYSLLLDAICDQGLFHCLKFVKRFIPRFTFKNQEWRKKEKKMKSCFFCKFHKKKECNSEYSEHSLEFLDYLQITITKNHFQIFFYLLKNFKFSLTNPQEEISQILEMACRTQRVDILQFVEQKFSLNSSKIRKYGKDAILCLCSMGNTKILNYFSKKYHFGREILYWKKEFEASPISIACEKGHLNVVIALHQKFNLNTDDMKDKLKEALCSACKFGHLQIVKYLCEEFKFTSSDVVERNNSKFSVSPLVSVCEAGQLDIFMYLDKKFNFTKDQIRVYDNLPLRVACRSGKLNLVSYLGQKFPITIHDIRASRNECLQSACGSGIFQFIFYLTQKWPLTRDDLFQSKSSLFIWTAFDCACWNKRETNEVTNEVKVLDYLCKRFQITVFDVKASRSFQNLQLLHTPASEYLHRKFNLNFKFQNTLIANLIRTNKRNS